MAIKVEDIERKYVINTYNTISKQFDGSRFCRWPEICSFLDSIAPGSLIGDIGCGNGKYLAYRYDCIMIACDVSEELLQITKNKYDVRDNRDGTAVCYSYTLSNMINLAYRDNLFDAIINVAVLHHISTHERRIECLREMIRTVRDGGQICISVWADEQNKKEKWVQCNIGTSNTDYMIPFDKRNGEVHMRYYHLFTENDFRELLLEVADVATIKRFVYDKDNWIAILVKI
jgi:SAM-dependent methyltransferase